MSVETRAYDNEWGDPVAVIVVTGSHDVSRLIHMLDKGNCEQIGYGAKLLRQLKRHNGGRAALSLLKAHGGTDFTEPEVTWIQTLEADIERAKALPREFQEAALTSGTREFLESREAFEQARDGAR